MSSKVVPFELCVCGKRGFDDEQDAQKALGRARSKRMRIADKSGTRRGVHVENRTYWCPAGDIYHLTGMSRRDVPAIRRPQMVAA